MATAAQKRYFDLQMQMIHSHPGDGEYEDALAAIFQEFPAKLADKPNLRQMAINHLKNRECS